MSQTITKVSSQASRSPDSNDATPTKIDAAREEAEANRQEEEPESHVEPTKSLMLPPHTPGRVSLLDLMANPEDFFSELPQGTPSEQVTWKHVPGVLRSPSSSMKTTQKSKKRSHSSSPVSSQSRRSKHFRGEDSSTDLKTASQSLQRSPSRRSPNRDDPASILWSHYNQTRLYEPVLPALPPFEPSPHTPVDAKKDNSFRRTASCGNEWPTSNPKRRKLVQPDPHSTTKQIFASRKKEMLECELPRQSKVTILLETVQQSLAARDREQDAPSSSSPLPETLETEGEHLRDQEATAEEMTAEDVRSTASSQRLPANSMFPHGSSPLKGKATNLSDLSDLDFDDDDLAGIEEALTQGQVEMDVSEEVPTPQDCQMPHTGKDPPYEDTFAPPKQAQALEDTNQGTFDDGFDEFDIDDNVFDEELTFLADKVDSQRVAMNSNNAPSAKQSSVTSSRHGGFDLEDDDLDDASFVETKGPLPGTPVGAISTEKQNQSDNRTIKRYLILDVLDGSFQTPNGRKSPEKQLSIKDEKTKKLFTVHLRQSWYDTRCIPNSYVHLIGEFDVKGRCVVDDSQNMMILHPDHLISATVIGDAITCLRRAVLQDRVKATSPPEKSQVYGHILHEVFGEALKLNNWEWDTFAKIIGRLLPSYLESLYEIGMSLADTTEYLMTKMPLMRAWAELFVSATFKPDAVLRDRKGSFVPTAINKLLEIEEHVWSPMYGLKGNIDATVQAQVHLPQDASAITVVAPLELKTGKKDNNEAHRAQTALYTLLLSDRYDVNVTSGILYYMETSKTFRIEGIRNEVRQMIIWRNLLASYVHDKLELPSMIKKEFMCKRCYAQTSCFTYHKLVEGGDGDSSGLKEIFDDAVGHLQPRHQAFFKQWDELLTKEERDCMKFRRELWTMLSSEREQVGRCFSSLVIEPGSASENQEGSKINRYAYSFVKSEIQTGFSFTESQITVGEPIVISDEQGHFALANGYVTSVRPRRVTVAVDRRLQDARKRTKDFHAVKNQSFLGIMEVKTEGAPISSPAEDESPILYRLDKDEFSNGMATVRNNLIRIMEKDLFRAKELRELIVENRAPAFKHMSTAYSLAGPASQQNINVDQRAAIEKVMSARDYALVLGMPGTGKTTTIAHIIRALVSQGKSVLLTSYTHTAVDNILLKIKDDNIPILRLGAVGKVHPDVQSFADLSGVPKKSMEELERSWSNSKVVATTCLSINHGIFNHRIFDYCIVDEASQITLPVCMGPIRFAHTFILVGDHYQLPPLVQNKEAQEGGLDISLFKLLSDAQPDSVVNLEHQYRMAEDIMLLSNELIYSDRLKCGTSAVATRMLQIPNLQSALDAHHHHNHRAANSDGSSAASQSICTSSKANCFLRVALLPSSRTVFLNTDTITQPTSATEILTGSNQRITNPTESLLTAHLLTTLIRAGVPARSIGVITFYRSQLSLLRHDVKAIAGSAAAADVEMHTADKYQGRDKEIILLSCVRSNSARSVGELLKDWRRVNVAITRARSKLIIMGSKSTLEGSGVPVLEGLVRIVSSKRWMINLPADAISSECGHKFEVAGPTQTQPQLQPSKPIAAIIPEPTIEAVPIETPSEPEPATTSSIRKPLAPIQANSRNMKPNVSSRNNHLPNSSMKVNAPFKRPTLVKSKSGAQPPKIVRGGVDLEKLFDKRPVMRDIVNNVGAMGGDIDMTEFNENDFEDDEMLLDF